MCVLSFVLHGPECSPHLIVSLVGVLVIVFSRKMADWGKGVALEWLQGRGMCMHVCTDTVVRTNFAKREGRGSKWDVTLTRGIKFPLYPCT